MTKNKKKPYTKVPRIFGTGLMALDLVIGTDPNEPVRQWAGGTCNNVLTILSFLGWEAYPIGRLNGDSAANRMRSDLSEWGVKLDFTRQSPLSHTPIVTHQIKLDSDGNGLHRFSMTCPNCGAWLPNYSAVVADAALRVCEKIIKPSVFFFDRVSRGALILAADSKQKGAVVVFEPSASANPKQMHEALGLADIVKYSSDKTRELISSMCSRRPGLLEIQTMGKDGLKYRSILPDAKSCGWRRLGPYSKLRVADAAGAGDWTTAGIIEKLCTQGISEFRRTKRVDLINALLNGQALAAWNCGFEGARGGMYSTSRKKFRQHIKRIRQGDYVKEQGHSSSAQGASSTEVGCPACY